MQITRRAVIALAAAFGSYCAVASLAAPARPSVDIRSSDGRVLVAASQIRSYEWATHTLTLAPRGRKELANKLRTDRIVSGIPFSVAVDGKAVYTGTFTTCLSSFSFATPVIVVDAVGEEWGVGADQLRVQLGYPSAMFFKGEDPRSNPRIREALRTGDKFTEAKTEADHTRWIERSLREIQTLKPGMTRADLLKVLQEEGGLSNRNGHRFVYRECPYIKVDVKFQAVGALDDNLRKDPRDKILRLSTPFLEWSITD